MKFLAPSKTFIFIFFLITYILIQNEFWVFFAVYLFLISIYLYFNHIKLSHFLDSLAKMTNTYLSPCDGKIMGILDEDGLKKIKIRMSLLNRWAIFLPQTADLELLSQNKGKRFWRSSRKWPNADHFVVNLALKNQIDNMYFIKIYPDIFGASPLLYMKTGDSGRIGGNMGRIFLGGTIVLELPEAANIIVSINDKVKAGESIIADTDKERTNE